MPARRHRMCAVCGGVGSVVFECEMTGDSRCPKHFVSQRDLLSEYLVYAKRYALQKHNEAPSGSEEESAWLGKIDSISNMRRKIRGDRVA